MDKKQGQMIWQDALRQVDKLRDKLGMPVDKEIAETVAIMRLMGIHTTMSCAGHLERITGGPYITFISIEADELRKQAAAIGDPGSKECRKIYEKAIKLTLREQQKIYPLLEEFYEPRKVAFGCMLTIRTTGYSGNRLYFQGAEQAYVSSKSTQENMLETNRGEMRAFTDFMKERYFNK